MGPTAGQPVFYYDLGSPACYLAAERIVSALPEVPEWEPVLASAVAPGLDGDRDLVEQLAAEHGVQPVRWPARLPADGRMATLAATYAKRVGRVVAFSLAAFRQEFAAGRDLDDEATVLLAGAASEMHPAALLKGLALRSVGSALDEACVRAQEAGVGSLPAIQVGSDVFEGWDAIERAAQALGEGR